MIHRPIRYYFFEINIDIFYFGLIVQGFIILTYALIFKLRALLIEALLATLIPFDLVAMHFKIQNLERSMDNQNGQYQSFFGVII